MEKQIKDMSQVLKDYTKKKNITASYVILEDYAEALYNAGYRKAQDVAREIFAEIESNIYPMLGLENDKEYVAILSTTFAELKNKYESEGEG